jgi:hypothetical protein
MLVLSRHSFDEAGAPVEWGRSWFRGDRYKVVARMGSCRHAEVDEHKAISLQPRSAMTRLQSRARQAAG